MPSGSATRGSKTPSVSFGSRTGSVHALATRHIETGTTTRSANPARDVRRRPSLYARLVASAGRAPDMAGTAIERVASALVEVEKPDGGECVQEAGHRGCPLHKGSGAVARH